MMTSTEMNAFDEMHQLAKKTAAFTRAAEYLLDNVVQVDDDESRTRLEDLAHLLGAASEAADATVMACIQLELKAGNDHRHQDA